MGNCTEQHGGESMRFFQMFWRATVLDNCSQLSNLLYVVLRGPAPKKRPMISGSKIESADFYLFIFIFIFITSKYFLFLRIFYRPFSSFYVLLLRMVFECLATKFKVAFTMLSTAVLAKEKSVFRRRSRITVNKVNLSALYKVNNSLAEKCFFQKRNVYPFNV